MQITKHQRRLDFSSSRPFPSVVMGFRINDVWKSNLLLVIYTCLCRILEELKLREFFSSSTTKNKPWEVITLLLPRPFCEPLDKDDSLSWR